MLVFLKRAKNYLLSEKVLLLSGDNEFISDTAETAEIAIVLTVDSCVYRAPIFFDGLILHEYTGCISDDQNSVNQLGG